MKIVIATRNRKKLEEFRRILNEAGAALLSLDDFPDCPETPEDQDTFTGNAVKKAVAVSRYTGLPAVSDDSGLEVYALGGAPGVWSARYAGESASDSDNIEKLLHEMKISFSADRSARFVCVLALAFPDGVVEIFEGSVEGDVIEKPVGTGGFGYDPIFRPLGFDRTFGEMTSSEKDALSHRGKALAKFGKYIREFEIKV
jgi:XTP/dITP diphosphohydrolase